MSHADPANLTAPERQAEIAELLARGVQRLFVAEFKARLQPRNLQDRLDALGPAEAPCGSHALNPKSREPAA